MMIKRKVLFVGSFKEKSKDGSVGGQMFACKIIQKSAISNWVDWTLIDSTSDSSILSSIFVRTKNALYRVVRFIYHLIFFKHDFVLIFVADGLSFWEKGLMTVIAKYFSSSKVILAPRSGFIINDIDKKGLLSQFIKFVFRKTDVIICQSNYWKEFFEKFTSIKNNSKFVIIENMIDSTKYEELPIRDVKDNEKVTILFMAWVTRNKGIFELLEAVKMLKKENFNFKVIIAGNGDEYENIKDELKLTHLENEVILKGWVLEVEKLAILAESDIFVLPTYFDGYPNSLLEAMASGKACIATNVGSIPDILNNMETGILIDKQDHNKLFQGLKTLIQSPDMRREMALKARAHVKEINSISSGISKFQKLFTNR